MLCLWYTGLSTKKTTNFAKTVTQAIKKGHFAKNTLLIIADKNFDEVFFLDQMSRTLKELEEKQVSIKVNIKRLPKQYNKKIKPEENFFHMVFIHTKDHYETYSHPYQLNLIRNWLISVSSDKTNYLYHIHSIADLRYLLSKRSTFSIFWGKKNSLGYQNFLKMGKKKGVSYAYTKDLRVLIILQYLSAKKFSLNHDLNFLSKANSLGGLKKKLGVDWEINQDKNYVFFFKQFQSLENRLFVSKISNCKKVEKMNLDQEKMLKAHILLNYSDFLDFKAQNKEVSEYYFLTVNDEHMDSAPFIIDVILSIKPEIPIVLINLKEKNNVKGVYELIKDTEESLMIVDYSKDDYATRYMLPFDPYSENTRIRVNQFIKKKDTNQLKPFIKSSKKKERHLEAIEINRELYDKLTSQKGSSFFVIYYYMENEYLDDLIGSIKSQLQSSVIYNIYKMNLFENDIRETVEFSKYPQIRFFHRLSAFDQLIIYDKKGMNWIRSIKTPFFSSEL